jgi:hypothetical protein
MTFIKSFMLAFLAMVLNGCASGWVKQGATEAEFQQDRFSCDQYSWQAFPVANQVTVLSGGYQTPINTNCQRFGNQTSCQTTGGQYVAPITTSSDSNSVNRAFAFKGCMNSKGYAFKFAQN